MSEEKLNQFIVFKIGKEIYALNTAHIVRIDNDKNVREVPHTQKEVRGITTVEESIVPLVDLRIKFDIETKDEEDIPFIIVCRLEEHDLIVGFVVDDVDEVIDIPSDAKMSDINETIAGPATDYIKSIYRPDKEDDDNDKNDERLLIILDVNKLLGIETQEAVEKLKEEKD